MLSPAATAASADPADRAAPLSVALVASGLGPGGTERVVSLIASAWAGLGWRVTLIGLDGDADPPFFRLDPRVAVRRLDLLAESAGLVSAVRNTVRRVRVLRAAIRRAGPDVVLSFGDRTNVLALLACAGLGPPVVVCERTDPGRHDPGRPWSMARRRLYPRAAAVVAQTEGALGGLGPAAAGRGHVIANPVSAPVAPDEPARPRVIAGVGRLTPEKGFDLLIEAFAAIAARHPDWTLIIHGEGPERPRLERLVAARGLRGRVRLPGLTRAPGDWIGGAGVFALPSRYEGFPNALGEALAAGLPAVAFDCRSGPRELVRDGTDGLLVPVGDTAALAAGLDRLLSDPDLRVRLGAEARTAMRRFAPEAMVPRWTELARAVARRRG